MQRRSSAGHYGWSTSSLIPALLLNILVLTSLLQYYGAVPRCGGGGEGGAHGGVSAAPALPRLLRAGLRRLAAAQHHPRRARGRAGGPPQQQLRAWLRSGERHQGLSGAPVPGIVSCADVLALAARDSVALSGGPSYRVLLGRRDGFSASRSLATQSLPSFNSNVNDLVANFANVGLSASDMVVLSGGHTIGKARCPTFASRLPPTPATDPTALDTSYAVSLSRQCPAGAATDALANLDAASPTLFDNRFYSNLLKSRGLLHSDQVLFSTPGATRDQVARYAADQASFFVDFAAAMVKMGNIAPLVGSQGQVRTHCGYVNDA
ncbi:hypothetical protein L7F22_014553 [Adiantum nelumboides]|nr:hypothetical protein [Adiantum nelumboides]